MAQQQREESKITASKLNISRDQKTTSKPQWTIKPLSAQAKPARPTRKAKTDPSIHLRAKTNSNSNSNSVTTAFDPTQDDPKISAATSPKRLKRSHGRIIPRQQSFPKKNIGTQRSNLSGRIADPAGKSRLSSLQFYQTIYITITYPYIVTFATNNFNVDSLDSTNTDIPSTADVDTGSPDPKHISPNTRKENKRPPLPNNTPFSAQTSSNNPPISVWRPRLGQRSHSNNIAYTYGRTSREEDGQALDLDFIDMDNPRIETCQFVNQLIASQASELDNGLKNNDSTRLLLSGSKEDSEILMRMQSHHPDKLSESGSSSSLPDFVDDIESILNELRYTDPLMDHQERYISKATVQLTLIRIIIVLIDYAVFYSCLKLASLVVNPKCLKWLRSKSYIVSIYNLIRQQRDAVITLPIDISFGI